MVGAAGTCQPAAVARRSQARRRARPAYDAGVQGERSLYRCRVTQPSHDTDSYRPAAILPHAAGRPLTRPGGRPQPLAAAYAPLTRSHTQARRHPRRAAPIAADAPPLQCVRLSTGGRGALPEGPSSGRRLGLVAVPSNSPLRSARRGAATRPLPRCRRLLSALIPWRPPIMVIMDLATDTRVARAAITAVWAQTG